MAPADKYAVLGNPIKHSKSPTIHSLFAQQCDQAMTYRAVRVELDAFERAAQSFFDNGGAGLNVTVPFKHDACSFANRLTERASRAAAVNTLTKCADGSIEGDNTDGIGLVRDMVANLGWRIRDQRVLILGAGGAVRGALEPLLRERPQELLIVNRSPERAVTLATEFSDIAPVVGGGYELIASRQFDLVINASSAGLSGEVAPVPGSVMTDRSCCYDMVYGTEPTPFMRWAAHHTAWAVSDGLGMLVEQAAQSFFIWRKVRPETRPVISQLRQAMGVA